MRDQILSEFLDRLAARGPAPGGGATAALHVAQAAALVGMVARYSDGPKYAGDREVIDAVVAESDELRQRALRLAEKDASAFTAVTAAYALPKGTDDEKKARSHAIADALLGACRPPAEVVGAAAAVVTLAERLLPVGNRNVVTDIAAAAEAARAGATTARVNIEVNLGGIRDEQARAELVATKDGVDGICERADKVTAEVRAGLTS
ncbi:cyclodeaminase/cyclohydrolase family protein [Amycolatopsis sp. NPDC059027]|uniref:cyclodeaminase/cyclohydrolase family protein n=1 Tax=Amycolatopsis sp. NPDC059027 TaxID=3346709 RepID=UPI00366CB823